MYVCICMHIFIKHAKRQWLNGDANKEREEEGGKGRRKEGRGGGGRMCENVLGRRERGLGPKRLARTSSGGKNRTLRALTLLIWSCLESALVTQCANCDVVCASFSRACHPPITSLLPSRFLICPLSATPTCINPAVTR